MQNTPLTDKLVSGIQTAVITNVIDTPHRTFGFAKLVKDGSQAYVGPNIFNTQSINVGDTIYCDVAENDSRYTDRGCQLRVTFVYTEDGPFAHLLPQVVAKPQPANVEPNLPTDEEMRSYILTLLSDSDDLWLTSEVNDIANTHFGCDISTQSTGRDLDRLFKNGQIARLALQTDAANKKMSKVAWVCKSRANEIFNRMMGIS